MATNPILSEIQGLSPGAQAALGMAGHALSQGAANPAPPMNSPVITPQMKAAAQPQDAGPAPQPTPMKMPGTDSVPSLGAPRSPNIHVLGSSPLGTLQGDKDELQRKLTTGSGESQIMHRIEGTGFGQNHPMLGKILGGAAQTAATLGDIGLSAVAPGIAANIPGTAYHHLEDVNRENKQVSSDEANAEKEAQTGFIGSNTAHTNAETAGLPQSEADKHDLEAATVGNLKSEATDRDAKQNNPPLATAYAHAVNQAIKEGRDPSSDPIVQHLSDAITSLQPGQNKAAEAPKTITAVRPGSNGPREYGWNPKTNAYDIDEGAHYEKPVTVNVAGANHDFAEQERGRGLLDKAEASYRTAQQGANGIRAMIDNANAGDKMSARMLPLEGALEITTANGVHRINRTEVDQYAGGGSAFDRLAGELKGATTGVPFTKEIMGSMKRLADIQEKGAYDNYKGAYDSATKRYKLDDEKPLGGPSGSAPVSGGSGVTVKAPNGKSYSFPDQTSADKFKHDAGIK